MEERLGELHHLHGEDITKARVKEVCRPASSPTQHPTNKLGEQILIALGRALSYLFRRSGGSHGEVHAKRTPTGRPRGSVGPGVL